MPSPRAPLLKIDIESNVAGQAFTIHQEVDSVMTLSRGYKSLWQATDLLRRVAATLDDITHRAATEQREAGEKALHDRISRFARA